VGPLGRRIGQKLWKRIASDESRQSSCQRQALRGECRFQYVTPRGVICSGAVVVVEDLLEDNPKDMHDAEGDFERGRVLVPFNGNDDLAPLT
jgi:hypothetical protein